MLDDITDLFNGHYASNSTLIIPLPSKTALSIVGAITNDSFITLIKTSLIKGWILPEIPFAIS